MNNRVRITDDVDLLLQLQTESVPCILLLNDNNRDKDTSKARYCAILDEEDTVRLESICTADSSINKEDAIRLILGDDYLNLVEARCQGLPLIIAEGEEIVIRELTLTDASDIYNLYKKVGQWIEPFFDTSEDIHIILDKYIHEVYEYYDYGIWAITLKDNNKKCIGIVGFTPRTTDKELPSLELGYALDTDYQGKGLALSACKLAIEYATDNIEYDHILINVKKDNIRGRLLAEKLITNYSGIEYSIL